MMRKRITRRARWGGLTRKAVGTALALLAGLPACDRAGQTMEITEKREISAHAPAPAPVTGSAERFHDDTAKTEAPRENPLAWEVPQGWSDAGQDATPGSMRLINLRFGAGGEGECYLSAMPGSAGGVEANINRWRAQMGLPEISAEEVAKLPRKTFLNREAVYVTMEGDFKKVGAEEAAKGYRMVGLVQPAPEFTLFVKMTGPKDLVEKNEAAFDELVRSIRLKR